MEAEKLGIPFLDEIPLDTILRTTSDEGNPILEQDPTHIISKKYLEIGSKIIKTITNNVKNPPNIIQ